MVVLKIDGERVTLKTGQESHGVKMISADTRSTVLEVDGDQKSYKMGTSVSTALTQRASTTEQIIMDAYGMFRSPRKYKWAFSATAGRYRCYQCFDECN